MNQQICKKCQFYKIERFGVFYPGNFGQMCFTNFKDGEIICKVYTDQKGIQNLFKIDSYYQLSLEELFMITKRWRLETKTCKYILQQEVSELYKGKENEDKDKLCK